MMLQPGGAVSDTITTVNRAVSETITVVNRNSILMTLIDISL